MVAPVGIEGCYCFPSSIKVVVPRSKPKACLREVQKCFRLDLMKDVVAMGGRGFRKSVCDRILDPSPLSTVTTSLLCTTKTCTLSLLGLSVFDRVPEPHSTTVSTPVLGTDSKPETRVRGGRWSPRVDHDGIWDVSPRQTYRVLCRPVRFLTDLSGVSLIFCPNTVPHSGPVQVP